MNSQSLFPAVEVPLEPVADRTAPRLWVRRLVLVSARAARAAVLRDVTFRPGLNVVRVAERPPGELRPVGHSVGKTLLARLLRYCLGESHFAVPDVLTRIAGRLPGAYALAEIAVAGRWWVVARPLRDAPLTESWAVAADDWRAGLGDPSGLLRYGDFQAALAQATVANLPELRLPGAGHSARWLDLLAWLARDQECSYQHDNEWRDPDANSGTGRLPRDDASLLMQWALGLLNGDEIDELTGRQQLLRDQANAQAEAERRTQFLEATRAGLAARLGLGADDLDGDLFALRANEALQERIAGLRAELHEPTADTAAEHHRAEALRLAQAEAVADSERGRLRALHEVTAAELRSESGGTVPRAGAPTCPLENAACPFHVGRGLEPATPARRTELKALQARQEEQLAELDERIALLRRQRAEAETAYAHERQRRQDRAAAVLTQIGRLQLVAEELREYEAASRGREGAVRRVEALERQARESRERQQAARGERDRRHRRLCGHFDWALRRLVGPGASGTIRLDARGLHPEPDRSVAANGAALTTLATVLGLDLACLAATVCGVGHLPGFWLHDSPKEADLEPVLYDRIFRLVLELEHAHGDRAPAFQYLITTTTPPPPDAAAAPYVRLTLDGREESGLLLGVRF